MTDVSFSFYIVVSLPETADLLDTLWFAWMFEESDAQLVHKVSQSRREKIKEMNTAVCVSAVAKSSTILLPIVINKLGHSNPQGCIIQLKCILHFLSTGQPAGQLKLSCWTTLLSENKQ